MNNTYKTNKTDWRRLVRSILFVALLLGASLPAMARDYVITWTNGGTTYYVGMNGNNIAVKTEFDITCVWTCRNGNNDANLGNTSYSLRNKNNTTYFLSTSCTRSGDWWSGYTYTWSSLTVQNSANNIWRSSNGGNGNVYAYISGGSGWDTWNRSASIRVVNNAWAMYDNNNDGSQNSQVTTTTPGASSPTTAEIGTLTVTPLTAALYQGENEAFTASASVTVTNYSVPAHTKYTFTVGSTDYEYFYYNNTRYTSIDDFSTKTTTTQTPSYAWTKTGDDGSNASMSSTNAASTTATHATQAAADKSVTLTVTASYSGADSKTANATVVLYGPMVAPTITRSGNSISIATTNINATIYYTTNGNTPTASSTPYTGSFDLTTSPTTVKAIAIRDGHSSTVTTETFNMQLPMPVISLTGAVATVTAGTGSPDGTKLYYTTDGTTPTSSSTEITSGNTVTLTNPQTIKVIAIKSGYDNSDIASAEYIVEGISGSLVILDDRENHSWSYYSDPDCPIRSLSPADVKITYYGDGIVMTGNADYTASSTDFVKPGQTNYTGGAKVNVGSEDENTFVYYKTLERTDGSTSANPTGRCPYTTIPNPFQVRPTYGARGSTDANNFTGWRGFQCWRLKSVSGGSVYSVASGGTALAVGAIINGETDIYFAPNSEYDMAVELEAVWARAYLIKGNQSGANNILSQNVGVERNFMTLTSGENYRFDGTDGRYIGNKGYAVTISNYYPSGEAPDNTNSTISGYNNMTLGADTKFENVTFNSMDSYRLSADNHSLIIGRGCSGTINYIRGIGGNVTSPSYTLRLESGTINYLSFLRGYSTTTGTATDNGSTLGGTPNVKGVLGCDYDRATNSGITNNLIVNNGAYYGYGVSENNTVYSEKSFVVHVKSGKIGNSFTINNSYTADAAQAFYIGVAANRVRGHRTLYMEGGEVASLAGGIDATQNQNNNSVTVRMTGGHVRGAVYGGAARSAAYGNRNMIVTGGSITGWLGGGCNGEAYPQGQTSEDTYGGITYGATKVYFGGTATCGGTGSNVTINGSQGGIVFGAGKGVEGNTTSGRMSQGTTVVVADECDIERNVYGGGNFGYAQTSTTVYVSGGTVHGSVFGGSNQNNGPVVNVTMNGGTVEGDVYGGSNQSGNITGAVNVKVYGGTVNGAVYGCNNAGGAPQSTVNVDIYGTDPAPAGGYAIGQVYGGGNQANYSGTPNVTVHCGDPISIGDVYGGGNAATVTGTNVAIYGGNVIGNVYAGANAANVNGAALANIYGGTLGRVFAGNNNSGNITGGATVNINSSTETDYDHCPLQVGAVFHGGNQAPSAQQTVNIICTGDATEGIDTLFGGANAANITSNVTLNVTKGNIRHAIFGGNNAANSINGNITVTLGTDNTCQFPFPTVFGGGFGANTSSTGNVTVTVGDKAGTQQPTVNGDIYGGSALGSVNDAAADNTIVNIYNGTVNGNVYGGGLGEVGDASKGTVNGVVTVNIGASDQTDGNCHSDLSNCSVYGCNNTNGSPQQNVTVNIYRTGHTAKNLASYHNEADSAFAIDQVFGGGNQADFTPSGKTATVHIYGCNNTIRRVFGGGNAAAATGVVTTIEGGRFGWVFGGGNGEVTAANIGAGGTHLTVQAGRIEHLFGASNANGTITGAMITEVNHDNDGCEELIREFFGGANLAPLNTSLSTTIACGTIFDKVYGGSKKAAITGNVTLTVNGGTINEVYGGSEGTVEDAADITGNVTLNIYGGAIGNAFGGSNINGNITGTVTVNLDWSESDCPGKSINYIYGASNLATYTPSPKPEFSPIVNLINGTVNQSVFGAGKGDDDVQAAGKVTSNPKVNMSGASAWVKKNVYGGGEMATVDGNTYVNISNGIVGPNDLDPTDIDGHGDVFGGGLGKAGAEYSTFAFVTNANVTLSGGTVRGSVFGGGENGHVSNNTSVTVSGGVVGVRIPYAYRNISSDAGSGNPVYAGNVYGGGRGVDHTANGTSYSYTAGRVYGNTAVTVSGGQIHHSVYGGGSLASVGTYTLEAVDNIYGGHIHNFTANTGNATVTINGGRIGPTWAELLLDDAGNSLVDANGDALNAAAATTIANNYECLGENEGMVYGSGRGVNYTNDGNTDHQRFIEMAFTNNTTVTISGNADVVGSVFGGGENGHVKGNTQVNIQGGTIGGIPMHHNGFDLPGHEVGHGRIDDSNEDNDELGYNETGIGRSVFRGNVYGGGRGIDHTDGDVTESSAHIFSVSAGRVYGNTVVNVTGGHIYHNVFGGGSVASVGTYTYPSDGAGGYNFFANPEAVWNNTGATTVNVSGGQIGVMGENEGYVYGGGRGIAGTNETQVSHLAFVNSAEVNISQTNSTHADVRASVFGGGMNGHVLTNTVVNISGGVIGGKTSANYGSGSESYDPTVFTAVPATVDYTINGVDYYSGIRPGDTITTSEGLGPATVFLGNVYGGGRGVDVTSGSNLSYTAGRVYGNTAVNITGGVIYHSVFGGGSIASVGTYTTYTADEAAADAGQSERYDLMANQPKTCTSGGNAVVTITGGRIGTNGRNNGRVFGSSRGMAGTTYRGLGYVNCAHVVIGTNGGGTSTPEIRGSVFGSGENGHVLDSTLVEVKSGHIGNGKRTDITWLNNYIGNVYGGGRGLDRADPLSANTVSPFAGRVYRNTYVSVTGGQIDNNVYGGGSLASVGRYKRNATNEITFADADRGTARVNISGGTIGIDGDENGHVFGASRGTAVAYRERNNDSRARLAYVADSRVTVTDGTIKGSVFGGGESGHVQRDARVSISGGEIGSTIPSDYNAMNAANKRKYDLMGNVYGAGRGIDEARSGDNVGYSMSAGYVRGRTIVSITGTPTIHRNVYGGGSMGTVGDYGPYCRLDFWQGTPANFARGTEANNYTDASNGVATVVIKGTVGTSTDVARNYGGNVYGSCRGQANDPTHDSELDLFYNEDGGFGEMAYVTGSHVIVETGANVWGNVYGGGENGHVDFGGTLVNILNGHVHGNVFGGGKGTSTSPTAGIVDGDATVNIGLPSQDGNTPDANGSYNTVEIDGNVFGGNDSYSSPLGTMTVNVYHTKHTAANKYPTLSNPVQASDTAGNNVESKYALKGVYGGGNLADVLTGIAAVDASDGNASHVYDKHYIDERISATNSNPSGYYPWPGGISRKSVVNIYNCEENTIMYVYGGGRSAYTIEDEVNIYGGRIYQAYAGGDGRADPAYVGYLDGANLRTVPANNNHGKAVINIIGGIVNQVFGGCNTRGEVNGTSTVNFAQGPDCDILNSEVFGGNNQADMTRDKEVTIQCGSKWNDIYGGSNEADLVGNITLNIVGGSMNRAFGGSKNADIDGNVTVNVTGGSINELFGGNNVGGNITGTITVNVDCDPLNTCADERYLGTVYGGGKDAAYTPTSPTATPSVNIKCGTVSGDVFGGGLGSTANCTSNPKVLIGGDSGNKTVVVNGNVYGGGSAAPVTGSTTVETRSSNADSRTTTLRNNVYGGGLGATATVSANTDVKINGNGTLVNGSVYGGGNAGQVNGNTNVEIGEE